MSGAARGWPSHRNRRVRETPLRLRILRLLAEGPLWGDEAARRLDVQQCQWWAAVEHCVWFSFDEPGVCGWTLTERGWKRLKELDGGG